MEILKLGADTRRLDNDKYESYKDECRVVDLSECVDLKEIPEDTFKCWTALEEVILPPNLEKIGDYAFLGTASLTKLDFPATLKEIGERAFLDSGLEIIELPSSLEIIKDFAALDNLKLLDMSKCVHIKKIPANFIQSRDMRRLVFLPPYLEEIGDNAFAFLNNLVIPASVKKINSLRSVSLVCLSENIESLRGLSNCVLNVPEDLADRYKRLIKKEGLSERNVIINEVGLNWTLWYVE